MTALAERRWSEKPDEGKKIEIRAKGRHHREPAKCTPNRHRPPPSRCLAASVLLDVRPWQTVGRLARSGPAPWCQGSSVFLADARVLASGRRVKALRSRIVSRTNCPLWQVPELDQGGSLHEPAQRARSPGTPGGSAVGMRGREG